MTPASTRPLSRHWIIFLLGVVLWFTMTAVPLLRAPSPAPPQSPTDQTAAVSVASLVLSLLPLACLAFGAFRHERILYHFLFPLLLLATQFGPAANGWDDAIQFVPNGIAFALYFLTAAALDEAPPRATPAARQPLNGKRAGPGSTLLRRDAAAFAPHAILVLAAALVLAVAPVWDADIARPAGAVETSSPGPTVIPFAAATLAFAALLLHVGRGLSRAHELRGYLRADPHGAKRRWAPSRRRLTSTLLFLAVGVAIGFTLVWLS